MQRRTLQCVSVIRDETRRVPVRSHKAEHLRHHKGEPTALRRQHHRVAVVHGERHGLLAQHVLARVKRRQHDFTMHIRGQADIHRIDASVNENLAPVRRPVHVLRQRSGLQIQVAMRRSFRGGPRARGNRCNLDTRDALHGGQVRAAHEAIAKQG